MIYPFMKAHEASYSVQGMCRAFGIARSGYYAWKAQGESSSRAKHDAELQEQIERIFEESGGTYGSPRIQAALQAQGPSCSRKRVARLMREAELDARLPRRRVRTTRPGTLVDSPRNVLARDFEAEAPNAKWGVDITAIATDEGTVYLAGVLDLFSRRLVGWAMDAHMPDELTQEALEMAILQRQPPPALLHHSDRGSQYTSAEYQRLLARHHMLCSLSGVGCCYDNAPMESFWGTLKTELIYRQHYATRAEAQSAIFAYIEGWYNRQRRHSALGYLSPEQFEHQFLSSSSVH